MSSFDTRRIDLDKTVPYNPMAQYLNSNPGPFPASEYLMNAEGSGMYHLHLRPDQVSRNIIIVGDPGRATSIAEAIFLDKSSENVRGRLEDVAQVVEHRGLRSITGTVFGTDFRLTVTTSGMGVGSAEITNIELMLLKEMDLASRTRKDEFEPFNIVRLGTCGALQKDMILGTPVIGAYSLDMAGLVHSYEVPAPDRFAKILERNVRKAIEDSMDPNSRFYGSIFPVATKSEPGLVDAMIGAARDLKIDTVLGITVSNAGFFAPQGRDVLRVKPSLPDIDRILAGVDTGDGTLRLTHMEMESAALNGINVPLGYPTTDVCIPVAHRVSNTSITPDAFANGMENTIRIVVEGLRRFHASGEAIAPYRPSDRQMSQIDALVENIYEEGHDFPKHISKEAIKCAVEMAERAHAPYAPEVVGRGSALICCVDGKYCVVGGCDVQQAAYPSSASAVSGAIHRARVEGVERGIEGVVLYESSGRLPVVYGSEKDLLGIFADNIPIIQISNSGDVKHSNFRSESKGVLASTLDYVSAHASQVADAEKTPKPLTILSKVNLDAIYDLIRPPFARASFMDAAMMAVRSSASAFAPFSNFSVGASLIINGSVVGGTNVESLPFSTGICAGRTALEIAVARGLFDWKSQSFHEQVDMVMTYVPKDEPAAPCGACRQALTEITSDKPILMFCASGQALYAEGLSFGRVFKISAERGQELTKELLSSGGLLTASFGAKNLLDQ